jgi:hypothetical protein
MPNNFDLNEIVFNNCLFINAVTEPNTYFMLYEEDKKDIKIKIIANVVYTTEPITDTDKEIIYKLHDLCNQF